MTRRGRIYGLLARVSCNGSHKRKHLSLLVLTLIAFLIVERITKTKQSDGLTGARHEVRHVAFLKIHKASSTTVMSILYRFGLKRGLTFVLPSRGNHLGRMGSSLYKPIVLPPPALKTYDILCNHVIFNKTRFRYYLPNDTKYIAIIREPFDRFRSAYYYYRNAYPMAYLEQNLQSEDHFENFIVHQEEYEPLDPSYSHTNNTMAIDFGFPGKYFHNTKIFKEYMKELDNTLDLVMVMEKFEESLILLRRLLNWNIQDMIFLKMNAFKHESRFINDSLLSIFKRNARLDYILYDHFYRKFERKIRDQGNNFTEEVDAFKRILMTVQSFCAGSSSVPREKTVVFTETKWNKAFKLTHKDCHVLQINELDFVAKLRNIHLLRLRKHGVNRQFFKSIPYD